MLGAVHGAGEEAIDGWGMDGEASRRRRSPGEYAMMWQWGFSHVCKFLFDSRPADDPPEPQRLEPVGVQGREVDDRVRPNSDADDDSCS